VPVRGSSSSHAPPKRCSRPQPSQCTDSS
jgi:hypothetical protein